MATINTINVSVANDGNGDTLRNAFVKANDNFAELNSKKVEAELGKGLSENDFTDADKTKLDGIEAGAQVQLQSDWNQTDNLQKDYIKNKPNIPLDSDINGIWQEYLLRYEATSQRYPFYTGPTVFNSGAVASFSYGSNNGGNWFNGINLTSAAVTNSGVQIEVTQSANFRCGNGKYWYYSFALPTNEPTMIACMGLVANILPTNRIWGYWLEIANNVITLKAGDNSGIVNTSSSAVLDHSPGGITNVTIYYHALLWRDNGNIYAKVIKNDGTIALNVNFPSATANLPILNEALSSRIQMMSNTATGSFMVQKIGYGTRLPFHLNNIFNI